MLATSTKLCEGAYCSKITPVEKSKLRVRIGTFGLPIGGGVMPLPFRFIFVHIPFLFLINGPVIYHNLQII